MAALPSIVDHLLGHPVLDRDHKQLVSLLSLLRDALVLGDAALARELAATLRGKAESHFRTEERMFESTGFPDREAHKQNHAAVLERLAGLQRRMEGGGDLDTDALVDEVEAIGEVFARHLLPDDAAFASFMRSAKR